MTADPRTPSPTPEAGQDERCEFRYERGPAGRAIATCLCGGWNDSDGCGFCLKNRWRDHASVPREDHP